MTPRTRLPSPVSPAARSAGLLALVLAAACGRDARGEARTVALDRLPRWTLAPELTIDGDFGSVAALAADSRGKVYVADGMKQQVQVFAPDGRRLATLGRRGGGPGEFTGLRDVVVGRGDTLFAFDVQAQRVTLFAGAPQPRVVRTVDVARAGERANYQVYAPARGGLIVPYIVPATEATAEARRTIRLRYLTGERYAAARDLLQVPDQEFLVSRDPSFGFSIGSLPYGRAPLLRLGPGDLLYYAWSDTLGFRTFDLQGRQHGAFALPHATARVTDADVRALLDSYGTDAFGQIARAQVRRAQERGRLPRTRPALQALVVDDEGRVWAGLVTPDQVVVSTSTGMAYRSAPPASGSLWLILGDRGNPLATARVPDGSALRAIRGGRAWAVATDDLGVQRVVRYAVRR